MRKPSTSSIASPKPFKISKSMPSTSIFRKSGLSNLSSFFIDFNDEVTVTGSGPVVEVWSTKSWKKIQNEADHAFANINEVKE